MKQAVIFDLDGTMWDATRQLLPAWNDVLAMHPETSKRFTLEDVKACMGKTVSEIAEMLLGDVTPEQGADIVEHCCVYELGPLLEHGGDLYPGLISMLETLKQRYSLYIVSNCQDGYVQTFLEHHQLWSYFEDFEVAGRTGLAKGDNIRLVMERNNVDSAVYVGDTQSDFNATLVAGVPFIHASYGFGSIDRAVPEAESPTQVAELAAEILG